MFRRVHYAPVASLDELASLAAAESRLTLIFDVDNTVAPQGVDLEEFARLVHETRDRFTSLPSVERVVFLTNGAERGVPWMESRGNKPWTTRRRLGLDGRQGPVWVVGDQVMTDGLLAWRLRARFFHLVIDDENEAPSQSWMRTVGSRVVPLLFNRDDR